MTAHDPDHLSRSGSWHTSVLAHRVAAAGLCSDSNGDRWFPAEPGRLAPVTDREQYERYARAACRDCTVQAECLLLALRIESRPGIRSHGIWGGYAPWERDAARRRIRDTARRAACARPPAACPG
jgi:hypothetical protein